MASEREGCGLFAFRESGRTLPIVSLYANCGWLKTTHGAYVKNNCERWPADVPIPPDAQAELDRLGMDRDGNQLIDVPEDVWDIADSCAGIQSNSGRLARYILSLPRREPVKRVEWVEIQTGERGNSFWKARIKGVPMGSVVPVMDGNEIKFDANAVINYESDPWTGRSFPSLSAAKAAVEKRLGVRS